MIFEACITEYHGIITENDKFTMMEAYGALFVNLDIS